MRSPLLPSQPPAHLSSPLAGLLPALSRPFLWLPHLPALVPGRVTFLVISVATTGLEISLLLRADRLRGAVWAFESEMPPWHAAGFSTRSGPSSRSSEGRTHSRYHPVVTSGWQHLPGKAPVTGQGALRPCLPCPVGRLLSWRPLVALWRPVASVCICVLGGGQPGVAGLMLAAFHGSAPCWGFPAPHHTDDASQQTCSCGTTRSVVPLIS